MDRSRARSFVETRMASAPNDRVVRLVRGRGATGRPLRLYELQLLEEPDGVRPFRPEFRLDLPHGHPARRNLLESLRFDVAVNRAENWDEFGDFANDLDSIQSIDAQDIRSGRNKFYFLGRKNFRVSRRQRNDRRFR